jgi:glycosyltransferase involved in cell wall biosynthesis
LKNFFLLPCFNQSANIRLLIPRIHQILDPLRKSLTEELYQIDDHEVLAVDYGSSDGTGNIIEEIALQFPMGVLHHDFNMGLAEVYPTLVAKVGELCENDDIVVIMDAEKTRDPNDILYLLARTKAGAS